MALRLPPLRWPGRAALLAGAAAGSIALAMLAGNMPSSAQPAPGEMLLEADTLTYDQDMQTVVAAGNVRIEYNGTRLVAERIEYDRSSNRMTARGAVEILDAEGNRTFGDEIDISDDFGDGFINALQIETSDKTYLGGESAERRDGNITTLNSGVYTACAPCEEKPDKAPIWRIKAARIIWNGKQKIIRFERTRFELFGLPLAYFPALELPDHTVKRKTGLLFPTFKFGSSGIGFGVGVPYYWALSPTYDLTTTFTGLTKQGILTELEFRQRFNSGSYSVRAAGIYQLQPGAFAAGTHDAANRLRGMIGTTGDFTINPRWKWGWKFLLQSDENFAYTYGIPNYNSYQYEQLGYLTGLNDRNYFDLRAVGYRIQEATTGAGTSETFPSVLPLLDYNYVVDKPVAGGELAFNVNAQHVRRNALVSVPTALIAGQNIPAVGGSSGRVTMEAEWRRSMIAPGGLVLTPTLHMRGDAVFANLSAATQAAIAATTIAGVPVPTDLRNNYLRGMATAGLEARWPILFTSARTSHVVEPVAQLFVRPDAPYTGILGIPNEDAQSMVFSAGNLFARDKFSGYDQMEGGVRANVGLRYTGTFGRWMLSAVGGQSYHLAGINAFSAPNLVNAGAFSGLETPRSDYVAAVTLSDPGGRELLVSSRFDETTLELRRLGASVSGRIGPVSASVSYAFIQAQPLYGFASDRQQIGASASTKLHDYWRAFGSVSYDLAAANFMQTSIGFSYDDECFGLTLTATQSYGAGNAITGNSIGVQFSLRTIGDFGQTTSLVGLTGQ